MCEIKTILVSVCLFLLVTASSSVYCVYPEKNLAQYSEIKIHNPCQNEYKKFCLNVSEGYYLIDEDTVGFNCTWLYGGKCCEKYMWWTLVRL